MIPLTDGEESIGGPYLGFWSKDEGKEFNRILFDVLKYLTRS